MLPQGAKSMKLQFLGALEKFVSVGFTRQSQRQIKMWDPKKLDKPLKTEPIDQVRDYACIDVNVVSQEGSRNQYWSRNCRSYFQCRQYTTNGSQ